jgi:hypothetical protein
MHCASVMQVIPSPTLPHEPPTHGAPTQSASDPHPVAQARIAASHFRGVQAIAVGVTQAPALHCDSPFSELVTGSQDPAAQTVPLGQYAQLPLPSHFPVRPQVDSLSFEQAVRPGGAAWSTGTFVQVPLRFA